MLSLTNSSEALKLSLAGAVSATEATYMLDERDGNGKPLKPSIGQTTGATAVTIASGPSATNPASRFFGNLFIYNADSATITVTLTYVNSAGSSITLFSQDMLTKDVLCFNLVNLLLSKTNSVGQSGSAVAVAQLDGVTAGTVTASKGLVVDANKDLATLRNLTATNYDAGSSGVAGTLDVFPTTAAKGKLSVAAADNAGNTTNTLTNASQAEARTWTLRDCGATAAGVMLDGQQIASADGAITLLEGTVFITKAGVAALTLADPTTTTDDGKILRIVSVTANAHTVSNAAGSGFNAGGAGTDVGTFGGAKGDNMIVQAYQGKWYVLSKVNVTLG